MSSDLHLWPFEQAAAVLKKVEGEKDRKHDYILLETGYGPSGLPHIGTFGEVARTTWVRTALENMTNIPVRLFAFSDDLDGLRKVPDNVPNGEMLKEHLGKPLCDIPDPFGEEESYSAYMNKQLCRFLDHFGFDYEFKSSKDEYRQGRFNEGLLRILQNYDAVKNVVVPTLGQKKGAEPGTVEWSPFLPLCEKCGKINTTRVLETHVEEGEVTYACEIDTERYSSCGYKGRTKVTDGRVKCGWKVDWALRWYCLGVDYEMYGKDLIDSATLSAEVVRVLGGTPPAGMFYELFLDEHGQKISKSKGNGMEIDEWLKYGPIESLSWFIFENPVKAKKLYFEVVPRSVDNYLNARSRFGDKLSMKRNATPDDPFEPRDNPVWFIDQQEIRDGKKIAFESDLTYSVLLNLVNVLNTGERDIIWGFVEKYDPTARETNPEVFDRMIDRAIAYYRDYISPTKKFEAPPAEMLPALQQLIDFLDGYEGMSTDEVQNAVYSAGKENGLKLGDWFRAMYQLLLGQPQGPRLGTFIYLYGIKNTKDLIIQRLKELRWESLDALKVDK